MKRNTQQSTGYLNYHTVFCVWLSCLARTKEENKWLQLKPWAYEVPFADIYSVSLLLETHVNHFLKNYLFIS